MWYLPSQRSIVLDARCALLLYGLLWATGCSSQRATDYSGLNLLAVSGQVTLEGEPLQGATIRLEGADQGYSYGVTDVNGHYTMMLNSEKTGVLPGIKTVRITSLPTPESGFGEIEGIQELEELEELEESEKTESTALASEPERVPRCYNRDSKLKIHLTESDRALDFHLKSDCS